MNIIGRQQAPLDHLREKPQRQGVAAAEAALSLSPHRHRPFFAAHRESPHACIYFPFITGSRPHPSRNVGTGEGRPSQALEKGLAVTQPGAADARFVRHAWPRILDLGAAVTTNARDGGGAVHRQELEAKRAVERDEGWYLGHLHRDLTISGAYAAPSLSCCERGGL